MKLKTVIVIYNPEKEGEKPTARKYRKVSNITKLCEWLAKHNAGHWSHLNIYDKTTKQFEERIYQ